MGVVEQVQDVKACGKMESEAKWRAPLCPKLGANCCISCWCPCFMMYMLTERAAPFELFSFKIEKDHAIIMLLLTLLAMTFGGLPYLIVVALVAWALRNKYAVQESDVML